MSLGKTLMNLSHRNRWILFSSLVQSDGSYKPQIQRPVQKTSELDISFQHRIFKKAERISRVQQVDLFCQF